MTPRRTPWPSVRSLSALPLCLGLLGVGLVTSGCKKETPEQKAEKAIAEATENGTKLQSVGRAHLPEGCEVVFSLDWPRFKELKSVKQDIEGELAKLEAPPIPNAPIDPETAADLKQFKEFLQKTKIDLRKDPGELAVCLWKLREQAPGKPPTFVAVLGGNFIPGAAVRALDSFPEKLKAILNRARSGGPQKPAPEIIEIQGVKTAYDKADGIYLAQAKDGAFVIASDRGGFEKALQAGKAYEAYRLPAEPIAVAVTPAAAPVFAGQLAQSPLAPLAAAFNGGSLGMQDGIVKLRVEVTDPKVLPAARANLEQLMHPDPRMPPNPMTQALAGAKLGVEGSTLTLDVPLPDEMTQGVLQGMGAPRPVRPTMPPGAMPPGAMPPGALPPGALPPGAVPPPSQAPVPPPAKPAP